MTKENKDQLNALLTEFFNEFNETKNVWNADTTATILKGAMINLKRWRVLPRGNPAKGMRKFRMNQAGITEGEEENQPCW